MRELKEETGVHSAEIIAEVSFFFSFFVKRTYVNHNLNPHLIRFFFFFGLCRHLTG